MYYVIDIDDVCKIVFIFRKGYDAMKYTRSIYIYIYIYIYILLCYICRMVNLHSLLEEYYKIRTIEYVLSKVSN